MSDSIKNNDGLRELFSGLERSTLPAVATENIMARIGGAEAKEGRGRRFWWVLFPAAAVVIAGIVAAVRYIWPNGWGISTLWSAWTEDALPTGGDWVDDLDAPATGGVGSLFDDISFREIWQSFEMPKVQFPDISFDIPSLYVFLVVCGALLLVFDQLMRRRYNRKHSAEM